MFRTLTAALLMLFLGQSVAAEGLYTDGEEYRTLTRTLPRSVEEADKVEVLEFFWYGCPHCFSLEPYLEKWAEEGAPESARLIQVPAALNPNWRIHARAFYVAKTLGVLDSVHGPLMEAIHVEGKALNDKEALAEFFSEQGVSEAEFEKAFASFAVETGMRRAAFLAERAGISAVPSIIVAGKYETSVSMAGSPEELLEVINYLVEREAGDAS